MSEPAGGRLVSRLGDAGLGAGTLAGEIEDWLRAYDYRVETEGRAARLLLPGRPPLPWHTRLSRRRLRPVSDAYEPVATALFDFLADRIGPTLFLDLGAAEGYFSALAASYPGAEIRTLGIDMRPDHVAAFRARAEAIGAAGRMEAMLAGLSDEARGERPVWYSVTKMFERPPPASAYRDPPWIRLKFRLLGRPGRDRLREIRLPIHTVDSLVAERGRAPGILKIDVDGAEGKVLSGARQTLVRARPAVMLELHKAKFLAPHGIARADVPAPLFEAGYRAFLFDRPDDLARCRAIPLGAEDPAWRRTRTDLLLFV